jgi:hypothetical protein
MPRQRRPDSPTCLHTGCTRAAAPKHRGLCSRCYANPLIRACYPKHQISHEAARERGAHSAVARSANLAARRAMRPKRVVEGTPDSSKPTFPWSDKPLDVAFPCDCCLFGEAPRPRGLCPNCAARHPDWEPEERPAPPVILCRKVCEVGR